MPTDEEYQNHIKVIEQELINERNKTLHATNTTLHSQMSGFNSPQEDNLIRFQLDLREDLDRIYHLLKGNKLKEDDEGNLIYVEADDDDLKPFNEFGVQLIMNIMSFYLNRNTILSNYKDDVIDWKVYDFGLEITDLIFNRYEEMGMDTPEKIKMFPMIVKELVDTIHSAYLRAYHGGERESLRSARLVTQSEPLGNNNQLGPQGVQIKRRWYNPATW